MSPSLRKAVAAAIGGGAVAIASVLITGPSGDDGLEGVSYIPYEDIVGVWTVCHGHTGKDIIPGKTYTEAECKALLNKDLATVARQINPYINVDIPETTRGALYSFVYNVGAGNFRTSTLLRKINQGDIAYKDQRDKATSIIADMQKRQRDVAELDARYTKELADANATIESLRDDVSAGRKRLQVAASCAKSKTGASGMGDGESPGLTADAELNYYRLRSGIDRITAQVNYLQEYIRTQCLK